MEVENHCRPEPVKHPCLETDSVDVPIVWDASALDRQVGRDAALQARLLAKFIARSKLQVAELSAAAGAGQALTVAQIAHQLKAAARSVGAMQLGEYCQRAETAGYAGQVDACKTLATKIEEKLFIVSQVIQESLA